MEEGCLPPPSILADLWEGDVFAGGKVKVDAELVRVETSEGLKYWRMQWSVVRS